MRGMGLRQRKRDLALHLYVNVNVFGGGKKAACQPPGVGFPKNRSHSLFIDS